MLKGHFIYIIIFCLFFVYTRLVKIEESNITAGKHKNTSELNRHIYRKTFLHNKKKRIKERKPTTRKNEEEEIVIKLISIWMRHIIWVEKNKFNIIHIKIKIISNTAGALYCFGHSIWNYTTHNLDSKKIIWFCHTMFWKWQKTCFISFSLSSFFIYFHCHRNWYFFLILLSQFDSSCYCHIHISLSLFIFIFLLCLFNVVFSHLFFSSIDFGKYVIKIRRTCQILS